MSLLPIPRPERAEGTVLAALLAALLALMVVTQLLLPPEPPALPDVPPAALRGGTAGIAAVTVDPVLSERSIFLPVSRGAAGGGDAAATGPLEGATPAGIVRVRGAARVVLQTPGGGSVTLRPGQAWRGWRLVAIGRDEVRFARGTETVTLGLGADTRSSYPGFAPPGYAPRAYRPNQADEQ